MQITRTIEARDVEAGMRLTMVEGASMRLGIDGLLVEMVRTGAATGTDPDDEMESTSLDVWHDTWMFGIEIEPEAHVQVTWDDDTWNFDPPEAPSRAGQVRVHGAWQPAGQTAWAPKGYPGVTPRQG